LKNSPTPPPTPSPTPSPPPAPSPSPSPAPTPSPPPTPTVSIVILTTRKEIPENLFKNLEAQSYTNFEILIANEKGCSIALNNALNRARGDIFIRIDDDVELPEKWLESLIKPFSDDSIGGVTGPTFVPALRQKNRDSIKIWKNPNWFLRWLVDWKPYEPARIYNCGSVSYGSNFINLLPRKKYYQIDHLEGTNWAMRTELIRKVGGFDPKFDGVSEWIDTDVEFKIKKLGYKLYYNVEAYLWHLLEKGEHYNERFDCVGRIKNWLRFHYRHSKFHYKKVIFLIVWILYFISVYFRRLSWKKLS